MTRAPSALLCTIAALMGACEPERFRPPAEPAPEPPPDKRIQSLDGLFGTRCDAQGLMVRVFGLGLDFCIDRFEASILSGDLGNVHQGGGDDTVTSVDGSTTAIAQVALGVLPATHVSWYQAKAACLNAGKRLCSVSEWELACRGQGLAFDYPYGNEPDDTACNGFFQYADDVLPTGSLNTCASGYVVYDLSGNVEEWLETPVQRTPTAPTVEDRAVRGGGFRSNTAALGCSGVEFHEAPGSTDADRGFRCCSAAP